MMVNDSILIIGHPKSGKTTFLAQFFTRVKKRKSSITLSKTPENIKAITDAVNRLASGEEPITTPADENVELVLPLNVDGEKIDLVCPDYGGEQVNVLTELMEIDDNWQNLVNCSDQWILFIRPYDITPEYDLSINSYEEIDTIKSTTFKSPGLSQQSKFIELLQSLLYVKNRGIKHLISLPKLSIVPQVGTDYHRGIFATPSGNIDVVVGRTGQTNINAALETERALESYHPSHAFYVGVAGGLKDVEIGDIVIGSDVIGFERGKAEEGDFKPRPQFGASSYDLERAANSFAISDSWKAIAALLVDVRFATRISVLSGTIASGEKVDASCKSDLHKSIKTNASHALAIEMEGLGFLKVCMTRPAVKSLLLRGISDLVNDKGEMDRNGSQHYASQNVAAFLFGLITELDLSNFKEETSTAKQLFEIVCKLYPRGVEDRRIWERAGGDLSMVTLTMQGKGQWFEAIRLIEQGGGGAEIALNTLIKEMLEDYTQNKDLLRILNAV